MEAIFDIKGASGGCYRFRACAGRESLPHIGGNYVFVREEAKGPVLVAVGLAEDLTHAAPEWDNAGNRDRATHLFTRLNVSSAIRRAEHADIAGLHPSARQYGFEVRA
jgi:hypothetical protein